MGPVKALTPQEASRLDREATYRSHIMAAAERLVGRHGLERTKMQDVAAEARVALATIYRLYPTKQDLYEAVVRARAAEVLDAGRAAVTDEATPIDNLMNFTLGMVAHLLEHPDALRLTLRTTPTSWGLGEDDADWAAARDFHADLVHRCLLDGTVLGTDARLVARLDGSRHPGVPGRLARARHPSRRQRRALRRPRTAPASLRVHPTGNRSRAVGGRSRRSAVPSSRSRSPPAIGARGTVMASPRQPDQASIRVPRCTGTAPPETTARGIASAPEPATRLGSARHAATWDGGPRSTIVDRCSPRADPSVIG